MAVVEASNAAIEAAAQALRGGKLVAFPTETVYGLGADASNGLAVAAIFAAKGRPRFNPLIVHVRDIDAAARLGDPGDLGRQLAAAFWPGALSLVMRKRPHCAVADLATAGLETIALRVPRHAIAQALLRATDRPIAAPSANLSGRVSPTTAAHVQADLGDHVAMILDGGPTSVGLESTVVDVTGDEPIILRLGGIARDEIARVLGRPLAVTTGDPDKADIAGDARATLRAGGQTAPRRFAGARRRSAAGLRQAYSAACRADNQPQHIRRSHRGRRQSVLRPARSRRLGRRQHRRHADPERGTWRGHQRPAAAGGEDAMSETATAAKLTPELLARLVAIVGPEHALTDPDLQLPYLREWRDMYEGRASIVLRPGTTEEVSAIMALAHAHGYPRGAAGRQYRPGRRADADATGRCCCRSPACGACVRSTRPATR